MDKEKKLETLDNLQEDLGRVIWDEPYDENRQVIINNMPRREFLAVIRYIIAKDGLTQKEVACAIQDKIMEKYSHLRKRWLKE